MELKVIPGHGEGRGLYHVVDTRAPESEQPAVIFSGNSWAEAEQYIADLGGG